MVLIKLFPDTSSIRTEVVKEDGDIVVGDQISDAVRQFSYLYVKLAVAGQVWS